MPTDVDSRSRPFWVLALHLAVLCGFAVAQPLFDLLGRGAEFFVAHQLGATGIVALTLGLSLALPAALVGFEALASLAGRHARAAVHLALVFVLVTLFLLPTIGTPLDLSPVATVSAAAVGGALLTAAYARTAALRTFVTVLSPSILAFPLLFLTMSPVSRLVFAPDPSRAETAAAPVGEPAPIVFVLFDEFEAGALLDADKTIDPVRFPHFAALARESWWFPYATTAWIQTQKAVPAMLSGLRPRDPDALPTIESHPHNLFTWLSGRYEFNVLEPLTRLCPERRCRRGSGGDAGAPKLDTLLSDLGVIYLHVVLPKQWAERSLPSLDGGWMGFGQRETNAPGPQRSQFRADVEQVVGGDRGSMFLEFVRSIKPDNQNTLHFVHMLLPHDPYIYFPSGMRYEGGGSDGLTNRIWTTDPYLPTLAYQRYLLQTGFVDGLIGQLTEHLKSIGLYDSALIVITADHGKSFRAGQPKRALAANVKETAPDIFQVPLFIKLPGQKEGRRSEKRVNTLDLLPTLADVLKSPLPWKTDGVSIFSSDFPAREFLDTGVLGELSDAAKLDLAELTSYPRLPWKLETFGARTPLDGLAMADPYQHLVGRRTSDLPIIEEGERLELVSDQLGLLGHVEPATGELPALLRGRVAGGDKLAQPMRVAFALNGVVQVTARTTEWRDDRHFFAVMLPEKAFRDGRNTLEAFSIVEQGGQAQLLRIVVPATDRFSLVRDGAGERLVGSDQNTLALRPGALVGAVDAIQTRARRVSIGGWAIDAERGVPASQILVFLDGRQIYSGKPSVRRPDVAKVHGEKVVDSGYRLTIPVEVSPAAGKPGVRIFAVSDRGVASELATGR